MTGSLVGGTCDADAETWRVGSSAGEGDSEMKVLKREDRRGTIHDLYTFN